MNDKTEDESNKPEVVLKAYRERLSFLKKAQEYSKRKDIPRAVERYAHYLNVLAAYYRVPEEQLKPSMFDPKKDITELLLISHAYWDLAKAYDRSPKLLNESIRCLDQFVKFTQGNKFQYVNAQMCKKFIKKRHAHHPKNFQNSYKKLYVKGKACYIATYCFGENDPTTDYFRLKREQMGETKIGLAAIAFYYKHSPKLTSFCEKNSYIGKPLRFLLFKPTLLLIKFTIKSIEKTYVYFKKTNN